MARTLDFTVIGEETLHCASCEQRVDKALRRVPGVQAVQANSETQRIRVTIDPAELDAEQVREKLRQIGYEVTSAPASR